jgi:quercetin dioxygenase-like cupin family protein
MLQQTNKLNRILTYFNKSKEVIAKFRTKNKDLISFEELKKISLSKSIQVIPERPGAIVTTRIDSDINKDSLSFRVEMKKGEKWSPHVHDCWEIIVIYKGECIDTISRVKADERTQMFIKPNTLHSIECLSEEAIFYVEFNKPPMNV